MVLPLTPMLISTLQRGYGTPWQQPRPVIIKGLFILAYRTLYVGFVDVVFLHTC